jgi:drug/metabolite transporter (DMT)-like permease
MSDMNSGELSVASRLAIGAVVCVVGLAALAAYNAYQDFMWRECVAVHSEMYCSLRGYGRGL